jgi:hypothetical protein
MYFEKKKGSELPMKRMHIHVSVPNIAASIPFYSKMFASEPTVIKSDYAKWQLEDPKSTLRFLHAVRHLVLIT